MKRLSRWAEWALWLAAPPALVLLLESFARGSLAEALDWALRSPRLFFITLGMVFGLCFVFSLFRSLRLRCAFTLAGAWLMCLLGIVSRYKMRYRLEPALLGDIYQLGDAWAAMHALPFEINYWEPVLVSLFWISLITLCCFIRMKTKRRLILPVIGLALLIGLPGVCTFENAGGPTRYDLANHAHNEGMLYTALAVENQRRAMMRMDYQEADVRVQYRALMETTPSAQSEEQPNLILVLSESFTCDDWLSRYLQLSRPITPFFDSLTASCQSGWLRVPKAGGGTSETEFEVLTGLKSQYATNPYALGLPPIHSLASTMRHKGYHASAIHWYTGVYYNRYHNLQNLGFDEFHTTDTCSRDFETCGMFTADREHYASALEMLKRTPELDFLFLLTMQNHGGYDYDDFRKTLGADKPFFNAVSPEAEQILCNYCHLLTESDRALEAFIHGLETYPEPVTLVFFGDHIPPFGEEIYAELGLSTADEESHLTPYFIWTNTQNQPSRLNLNAWQLGAQALLAAGQLDDPFLSYVEMLRQEGKDMDAAYDLFSYDALFGKQYAYAEGGLTPRNETFQIGGSMALSGFDAARIGSLVYLRPRLAHPDQAFKLSINGCISDIPALSANAENLELQCVIPRYNGLPYNQSGVLCYPDAQALLEHSGELPVRAIPLPNCSPDDTRGSLTLYRTRDPIPSCYFAVLTLAGEPLDWQPPYGLTHSRQYAIDEDGTLLIALSASDASLLPTLTLHLLGE